ncbi:hypothetical protein HDU83_006459 [Entophlyctis luteolus]|nr:hypothetical protein HDU83_006459 [Entophlyctis luteolus]
MSIRTLATVLSLVAECARAMLVGRPGFISPDAYESTASLVAVVTCSATFKVTALGGMSCAQVAAATGVDVVTISALNPKFDCSSDTIPCNAYLCLSDPGTSTSDYTTCTTTYAVSADDSCTAVKSAYGLDDTTFKIMNPSVDCNALSAGMQLCLEATMGSATLECTANEAMEVIQSSKCSLTERVTSDTACLDFVGSFGVSLTDLHDWNSGLNCCSLSQNDTLCVAVGDSSTQVSSETSVTLATSATSVKTKMTSTLTYASDAKTNFNNGHYAGAQKGSDGTIPCGEKGTFTYNGNTVTVTRICKAYR